MKEKAQQNSDFGRTRSVFGWFALEKKKSITAACLLIIMLLMWVRVFIGKSAGNGGAGGNEQFFSEEKIGDSNNSQPNLAGLFIELPKIEGRNDRLTRDFFVIKGGDSKRFTATGNVAGTINEKIAKRLESLLKLDAIVSGINPQAFINNKLYKAGDKINISDGNQKYDCVIENISQTEVLIDCLGTKIKLELANHLEVIEQQ